jgi:hypothetical protein
MKNIAIVGSRSFTNYEVFKEKLNNLPISFINCTVVSGGAKGADSLARKFAIENKLIMKEFLPNWNLHGREAGFIRNVDIIKNSDIVIAFWDGKSAGTKHSIELSKKFNKKLFIIYFNII